MTQPRIVHVIGARGVAGAERVALALMAGGAARGWEQLVLNPFANSASEPFAERCALISRGLRYEPRSCDRLSELYDLRQWLRRSLVGFGADVVHAHLYQAAVAVASLPRGGRERRVLTHHHGAALPPGARGVARRQLDRWACGRFDKVVAVSRAVANYLIDRYRYPATRVEIIENGWEGDPLPRSTTSRSAPTVVCVGGFRPEKGHATLVSAFALVQRSRPDARLLLVGDGELRLGVVEQVKAAGLQDNVDFAGNVENVWPYLSDSDVFALASHSESFGIVIAEAMAAGLPIVAPALGGIPELVRPGVNGLLYPPGDVEGLARHIVDLLESPGLRAEMGASSRQIAQSFRMEVTVERYLRLYESLLALPLAGGRPG